MPLKTKVTEQGVLLPKKFFRGIKEVEIRKKNNSIVVVPIEDDPIFQLGSRPISEDVNDASVNHDAYIETALTFDQHFVQAGFKKLP